MSATATFDSMIEVLKKNSGGVLSREIAKIADDVKDSCVQIISDFALTQKKTRRSNKPCIEMFIKNVELPEKPPTSAKVLYLASKKGICAYNDKMDEIFGEEKCEIDKNGRFKMPSKHNVRDDKGKVWTVALVGTSVWKELTDESKNKWKARLKEMKKEYEDAKKAWLRDPANRDAKREWNRVEAEWNSTHKADDIPKRPRSAFTIFSERRKEKIANETLQERKDAWEELPDEKKKRYEDTAKDELKEQIEAMTEWLAEKREELGKEFVAPAWYVKAVKGDTEKTKVSSATSSKKEESEDEDDDDTDNED